jgi:protein-tyrosine phosphatase
MLRRNKNSRVSPPGEERAAFVTAMSVPRLRVLMVCTGNICRSPTAEAVLRHKLRERGLDHVVEVDSAGTIGWHAGEPPDARSQLHARRRGYDLSGLRARPVRPGDFEAFDLLLAMDWDNLAALQDDCPPEHQGKLQRLMAYAPQALQPVVPDPYHGGARGFDEVLDLVEIACDELVDHVLRVLLHPSGGTS